jgi:hypothetical protein
MDIQRERAFDGGEYEWQWLIEVFEREPKKKSQTCHVTHPCHFGQRCTFDRHRVNNFRVT